ncbi:MAG: sel1 repeat family protein [Methylococcaceae bacterium]|mgnify:CR=1 FL=1|jgi:TPR repeat protein|nr:sel1 repeat family protein [Methylococcaceae bacterium]
MLGSAKVPYIFKLKKAIVDLFAYFFWYLPFFTIVLIFAVGHRHLFPSSHHADVGLNTEIFNAGADMKYMGDMYYSGIGIKSNKQIAANWYLKAADTGDSAAAYVLGKMLITGDGVAIDASQGLHFIQQAAENGNREAQNFLGVCLLNGQGVAKDQTQAFAWFMKAAQQGLAEAQKNAGLMFFQGYGNLELAIKLLNQAANQGIAEAQTRLGLMYEDGEYLGKDIPLALFWYQKAAEQHDTVALRRLHELSINKSKAKPVVSNSK